MRPVNATAVPSGTDDCAAPPVGVGPRVLLVGENASMKMGGEASFPYLYFKLLRARGIETFLACHSRVRDEVKVLLGDDFDRVAFVEEFALDVRLWRLGNRLPAKLSEETVGVLRHVLTRRKLRRVVRALVARHAIDVIHEVTPISPKMPTCLHGLGAPVVIGPMCGGMDYPPAFQSMQGRIERLVEWSGRLASGMVNRVVPGKLRADALIVANDQTKRALPRGCRGTIHEGIPDIGVDLGVWGRDRPRREPQAGAPVRFIFLGRLVGWKGVELLLEAFARVAGAHPGVALKVLGDGPLRLPLEAKAERLGVGGQVEFAGWVQAAEGAARMADADVFVLPSLRECGGSAVFEAMALGMPVVVANWGGPGIYVNDECGIRVAVESREGYVAGLAEAMLRLARDPLLRMRMGAAARRHAEGGVFNWDRKIDRILDIYRSVLPGAARSPAPTRRDDAERGP